MIDQTRYAYMLPTRYIAARPYRPLLPEFDDGTHFAPVHIGDFNAIWEAIMERRASADTQNQRTLMNNLDVIKDGTVEDTTTDGIHQLKGAEYGIASRFVRTDLPSGATGSWANYSRRLTNLFCDSTGADNYRTTDQVRWLYHDLRRMSLLETSTCAKRSYTDDPGGGGMMFDLAKHTRESNGTTTTEGVAWDGYSRYSTSLTSSSQVRNWWQIDQLRLTAPTDVISAIWTWSQFTSGTAYLVWDLTATNTQTQTVAHREWLKVAVGTFSPARSTSGYAWASVGAPLYDLQSWLSTATGGASETVPTEAGVTNAWMASAYPSAVLIECSWPAISSTDFSGWTFTPPTT